MRLTVLLNVAVQCRLTGTGNRQFKRYFWAIENVPKKLWDVNYASQRSQYEGRRLRERVEGWIKCMVLNRMVSLGMPVSERIY